MDDRQQSHQSLNDGGPAGRLDAFLGRKAAEKVRVILQHGYSHTGAGGEWPHTLSQNMGNEQLLSLAAKIEYGS